MKGYCLMNSRHTDTGVCGFCISYLDGGDGVCANMIPQDSEVYEQIIKDLKEARLTD